MNRRDLRWGVLLVGVALIGPGCGGGSGAEEQSAIEQAFAKSVAQAESARTILDELDATPHIFDYSPAAQRTLHYMVEEPDLSRLSASSLAGLRAELERARDTIEATAEYQDLTEAHELFRAARKEVDRTFRSASAVEQAFIGDWVELMETGEDETGRGEATTELLRAEIDMTRYAERALQTGKLDEVNITLTAVRVLRTHAIEADASQGTFYRRKEKTCPRLQRNSGLSSLAEIASEFCSSKPPADAAPGRTNKTEPVTAKRKPPPAQLSYDSPISTQGLGPVLVGMGVREIERKAGVELSFDDSQEPQCEYASTPTLDKVGFMFVNGTLARVDVGTPKIRTLSGIRIGDSEAEVLNKYDGQIEIEPHYYYESGSYLIYVPADSGDDTRVIFESDGNIVKHIRSGRLPEVGYFEACA